MELVTIETFQTAAEAELARSALDAAGIENVLDDIDTVNMVPHSANMARGISLRVRREDADRARELLETEVTIAEAVETHVAQPVLEPGGCPQCGSFDVMRRADRLRTFAMISIAILGIGMAVGASEAAFFFVLALAVFALISGRSRCNECGESW